MAVVHPGVFIRRAIVPDGMSVTAAALVLGVGRPALSKLLNGRARLSPEMALRVEKAFGPMDIGGEPIVESLLRMQARYDADAMRRRAHEINVRPFR